MASIFGAALLVWLPFLLAPTSAVLAALNHEISKAEQKWLEFNRTILRLKGAAADDEDESQWCSHRVADPAPVYLVTSSIDLSNSGSARKSGDDQPLEERLDPEMDFMNRSERAHWAIKIRGITYELLRKKGSREVELKIHEVGSEPKVDVLGVLSLEDNWVRKIGVTFLPNEQIRVMVEAYRDAQDAVGVRYDPVFNNCQTFWNLTLEHIVCQCPDQQPLSRPRDHLGLIEASNITNHAKAQVQGSILSLLLHHRIPPIPQILRFTPVSRPTLALCVYLAAQLTTCYKIYNFAVHKLGLWHDLRTGTCNVLNPWCDAVAAYHGKRVADFSAAELHEHAKRSDEQGNCPSEVMSSVVSNELEARDRAAAAAAATVYDEAREMQREVEEILCRHIYNLGKCYIFGGIIGGICAFMYRMMGYRSFRYVELAVDLVLWMQFQHAAEITDGLSEAQPRHCRMPRPDRIRNGTWRA